MADDMEDNHLQVAWKKAVKEYEKATRKSLKVSSHDDLEKKCEELKKLDHGDLVITSVQQVLKVADLAVSAVPVISEGAVIFTALSYLVETIDCYRKNFTPRKVLDSLEDVEDSLRRVKQYMTLDDQGIKLDANLQRCIMNIFAACLTLCRLYTKIAEDSENVTGRAKNLMKAAIRWDGGLSSLLRHIKRATKQEMSNNIAAIRVSDISTNDKHIREEILERLKNYLKPDNKELCWRGMQDTLRDKHVEGVGSWVFERKAFESWANDKCHSDTPVLQISEEKSKGKTHLCSQIIHSLTLPYESQQQRSASIGWYFFPGNQMGHKKEHLKLKNGSQTVLIHNALKAVVWQLAQSDRVFRNWVVKLMNNNAQAFSDPEKMWTNVFSKFSQSSRDYPNEKPTKVFYLVLDGFGELENSEEQLIRRMVADSKNYCTRQMQFRLLLSGTDIPDYGGSVRIKPDTADHRSDAEHFINSVAELELQWDKSDEGHRLVSSILRKLEKNFDGDFRKLENCLQEVQQSNRGGISDLKRLEEEKEDISSLIIQRNLEAMNNKFEMDEFEVLKEVILCTTSWWWWPSLQQLDAYLAMQLGEKFKGDIESKLSTKFSGLFSIENGTVFAEWLVPFLEKRKQWTTQVTLYEDPALESSRNARSSINSDSNMGNMRKKDLTLFEQNKRDMRTAQFLLRSICEEICRDRPDAKYIFEYSATYLPKHLCTEQDGTAEAIDTLDPSEQKNIGRWLFEAFMDHNTVGKWLPMGDIDEILAMDEWVEQLSDIDIFWNHEKVREGFRQRAEESEQYQFSTQQGEAENLDKEDQRSEKSIPDKIPPVEPHRLLAAPAKVVASQWLHASRWEALSSVKFLLKIFRKIYDSQQESGDAKHSADDEEMYRIWKRQPLKSGSWFPETSEREVTAEVIKGMEKWALSLLGIKVAQSHYSTRHDLRIAETCMDLGNEDGFEEARFRCKLIIDREPLNVEALLCLSQLERKENGEKRALKQLMKVRHITQSPDFHKDHYDMWCEELERFWSLCERTRSVKEALTVCAELAVDFPDAPLPSTNALGIAKEWIMRQEKLDMSFEVLSMKRTAEGQSILTDLFCSNARSYEFHEKFHVAAQNRPDLVFETYKYAMKSTKRWIDVVFLRSHYGIALYRSGRQEDALKAWRQCVHSFKVNGTTNDESEMTFESFRPIVEKIGSAYCQIISTCKDSGAVRQYIRELEEYKAWIDDEHSMEVNYLALVLGRVYQLQHRDQKAVSSIRRFMSKAFALLDDDTQSNDWKGYFLLAELFTSLADDDNAQAAWSLVANVLESDREHDWNITCAGTCNKDWDVSKDLEFDLYVCRDCPHLYFERDCYELLQNSPQDHRSCSRSHKFLHVSKRRAEVVKRLNPGYVLVGRNEVWIDDWLEGLRRRYGIPGPRKGWINQAVKAVHVEKWKLRRQRHTTAGKIRNAVSKVAGFPH